MRIGTRDYPAGGREGEDVTTNPRLPRSWWVVEPGDPVDPGTRRRQWCRPCRPIGDETGWTEGEADVLFGDGTVVHETRGTTEGLLRREPNLHITTQTYLGCLTVECPVELDPKCRKQKKITIPHPELNRTLTLETIDALTGKDSRLVWPEAEWCLRHVLQSRTPGPTDSGGPLGGVHAKGRRGRLSVGSLPSPGRSPTTPSEGSGWVPGTTLPRDRYPRSGSRLGVCPTRGDVRDSCRG